MPGIIQNSEKRDLVSVKKTWCHCGSLKMGIHGPVVSLELWNSLVFTTSDFDGTFSSPSFTAPKFTKTPYLRSCGPHFFCEMGFKTGGWNIHVLSLVAKGWNHSKSEFDHISLPNWMILDSFLEDFGVMHATYCPVFTVSDQNWWLWSWSNEERTGQNG